MDFQAAWVQGYDGSDLSLIGASTLAYLCGRHVKFCDTSTGRESVYAGVGEAISSLAVHALESVFAFSETAPHPRIHVLSFPDFARVSTLADGAILDYHALAFGAADQLASLSTHPDFRLTIWNYVSGQELCHVILSANYTFDPAATLSFSPVNPTQLALTTQQSLLLWNLERSHEKFILVPEEIHLPATDGSDPLGEAQRAHSRGVRGPTLFDTVTPNADATVRLIKELTRGVVGHSLDRLFVRSHRSLIDSLHPACALRCAHSLVHSLPSSW